MFSEALRYEYARSNIRVMASCPGATDSNFRNTASEKSAEKLKQRISKLKDSGEVGDSCERVAQETLDAFLKNKHYIVPGKGNSKFAFLPRILSRARALKIAGDAFRKHTAN
jgi:short-subunit dehydrogenase